MLFFEMSMLVFLGKKVSPVLNLDASSAIAIRKKQGVGRIKHLSVKLLWLQNTIEETSVKVQKFPRDLDIPDIATKHQKANELQQFARTVTCKQACCRRN